ncbi:MAG: response regulator transcription factor [Holosporales bacterium]|jgi:two-component system cell cycle response regulator CtrA|nr:response regulator transcription factor [Holosporales bacterium]
MRVLVIEDDSPTARGIEFTLRSSGFVADVTDLGQDGFEIGRLYDYDIILLDLLLPDLNGYEVIRRLRACNTRTPILVISGILGARDRVKCLDMGADDYLTKPFDKKELMARIQAVVRRSKGHSQSVVRTGRLTVNLQAHTATVDDTISVRLTSKEYAILELLCLRKGTTLTKDVFLNHLYGGLDEPELKIIDVFICKLRHKLAAALDGENYIETVWGRGYVLRDPKEDTSPVAKEIVIGNKEGSADKNSPSETSISSKWQSEKLAPSSPNYVKDAM